MTAVDKVIALAKEQIGYLEKASNSQLDDKTANAGSGNYTKYARDLDAYGNVYNYPKQGYSWCDMLVDWLFIESFGLETGMAMLCQPYKGAGAGATYSAGYYKAAGRFHTSDPHVGDQMFFKATTAGQYAHTGLVVEVKDGRVYTIEGNTSNASGVIANGGGVAAKSYALNYAKIGGYGRPRWELVETSESENTAEKEAQTMDYETFKGFMSRYLEELASMDSSAWSADARQWAETNHIIEGDEAGRMMYKRPVTREETVTMLHRLATEMPTE